MAELMKGRIWVESGETQGSTFHVTVPLLRGKREPVQAAQDVNLADLRVLIIDDNATNRFVLREMVLRWSMRPTMAKNGLEALEILDRPDTQTDPPDVVILDVHMPKVDGFAVAERILQIPALRDVTILMLTSAERSLDVQRCREMKLGAYLVKPITQKDLRSNIVAVLGRTRSVREASPARQAAQGRPLRILLAEDNIVNQKVAVALLSKLGHQVVVAGDGRAAVEAFEREPVDLIFMDVQMPVMSGEEATASIRAFERVHGGHVPIVAMTARVLKGDREQCLQAGMDDYLSKPIHVDRVRAVIDRMIPGASVARDVTSDSAQVNPRCA